MVRHNIDSTHKLYSIDESGTATSISTSSSIASDARMTFQTNSNVVYCMNWVDAMGIWNGSTYAAYGAWVIGFAITPISWTLVQSGNGVTETVTGSSSGAQGRLWHKNNNSLFISVGSGAFLAWETITGSSSGATATITTLKPFAPAYSAIFNSCMWVSGRTFLPNLVFKSAANNYTDFTFIGGGDFFEFSESNTGLCASSQALFYFTATSIAVTGQNDIQITSDSTWKQTASYLTRPIQAVEWAKNPYCMVSDGSDIYFLSSSNTICKMAPGANVYGYEVVELSQRKYAGINNLMNTISKTPTSGFAVNLPQEMLIKWSLPTTDASFNDIRIVYDIARDKFLVDNHQYFYEGAYMPTRNKNYAISMIEPKVFRDEYSFDDEDAPIPFEYRTKRFYLNEPSMKNILRETRTLLDMNELATLIQMIWTENCQIDTKTLNGTEVITTSTWWIGTESVWDFAIWDEWWDWDFVDDWYTETYILRTKGNLNKKWRKFQFRFSCTVVAAKVRLKNITVKKESLDPITSNLTP